MPVLATFPWNFVAWNFTFYKSWAKTIPLPKHLQCTCVLLLWQCLYTCTHSCSTLAHLCVHVRSSDYQRISEHYKKKKNPPPWPSQDNRQMKTPPRRIHTSDSTGSLPPTPQHHQQQQQAFLSASAGSGSLAMNPRDRLNTIDIRPQPRMPEGGYDTYDVSMM